MSIETDAAASEESTPEDLARRLGEAITEMPVYEAFREKKEAVENDPEAQEMIREFEQVREEYMVARQTGQATEEDLRELQRTQEQLHDVPVMSEFLEAQSDLELRLQALNEHISEPLDVDFGEKAGGCCQD